MTSHHFNQEHPHIGRAWYAVPVSIFAAFVAVLVVVSGPEGTGSSGDAATAGSLAVMPRVNNSAAYAVPSAASVFTDGKHEVAEHVDTF